MSQPKKSDDPEFVVTQQDLSTILGLSGRQVYNLREKGMPWLGTEEGVKNGKPIYDLAAAVQWYVSFKEQAARPDTRTEADIRKAQAQARLAELEVAERERALVPIDMFEEVMGDVLGEVRARLLNLPSALASEMAAIADPIEARGALTREIDGALESIVQYGKKMGEEDPVLDDDFPHVAILREGGISTLRELRALDSPEDVPGIGPKRAADITRAAGA